MRQAGWEKRLKAVIDTHMALPADYAVTNCYIIPDDAVEAITGKRMHPAMYRGGSGPKTEKGAARRLLKHGFRNVEEAFAACFEAIPPTLAQRGDVGIVQRDGQFCGGVFTSIGFMVRGQDRIHFLPASEIKTAFRVE